MCDEDLPRAASRDEVELAKAFVELARYASTVVLALAAVTAALFRISTAEVNLLLLGIRVDYFWFGAALIISMVQLISGYVLLSNVFAAMFDKLTVADREAKFLEIRSSPYSTFSVLSGISVFMWLVTIGVKVVFSSI